MPQKLADVREPLNILYYGIGGTGKTTNMAAMANLGKIWMIDAESGIKRRAFERLAREKGISINVDNIETFPGPGEEITYDSLEAEWFRIREEVYANPGSYVGTCWDSITEIYKRLLDTVVDKEVARAEAKGRERERFATELRDYGIMTEQIRSLVRKFRDLPCHFAVSALERREQDDDSKVSYQPAITGALQTDLVGWMDMVCWTSVELVDNKEQYRGLFRPHGKYRGKDRLHAMPKWLVQPTFDRIWSYVDDDLSVAKDPVMKAAREAEIRAARAEDGKSGAVTPDSETKALVA